MPRMDPVARAQARAERAKQTKKVRELLEKGPIQRIVEQGIRFVEDVQGLNIGGKESGRIAREKAVKKAKKREVKTLRHAP